MTMGTGSYFRAFTILDGFQKSSVLTRPPVYQIVIVNDPKRPEIPTGTSSIYQRCLNDWLHIPLYGKVPEISSMPRK